jgi:hypothetical protein
MSKSRRKIAEELIDLQRRAEPLLLEIDGLKEALREICAESGEAFTEEVAGKGTVEVKAGKDKEFKGLLPELKPAAFLELSDARKKTLLADGLVVMAEQWSKATKPSVTVRL